MVSFMLVAISGRELAGRLDTFEIMFFRSLIGIGIVVGACAWSGTLNRISSRRFGLHVIRNAFHFLGQNLWLYAVTVIPLSQLFAFEFSTPLWVALFAPLFLAERLTATRLIAAGLGFAGIVMIARPGTAPITPGIIAAGFCAVGVRRGRHRDQAPFPNREHRIDPVLARRHADRFRPGCGRSGPSDEAATSGRSDLGFSHRAVRTSRPFLLDQGLDTCTRNCRRAARLPATSP